MELLQLRYFQTVARLESITKAAKHYRIPQPAMSQTIARLEHELGDVQLFDRRNKRIYINDNGRLFLGYVDKALRELDNGVSALTTQKGEIAGAIKMLAMENRRFVLSCVALFAERYPGVSFSISHDYYSDPSVDYDLCVASVCSYQRMNANLPFIREKIMLNVNENHPLAHRESVNLSEMEKEKFITMSSRSSLYRITYDQCRAHGFEPQVPFICDDPYFVRKYVSENMGVALVPSISWAGRFRSNTKLIDIARPSITATSYLLWDDRRYMTPAVKAVRDFMLEEAKKLEGNELKTPTH